MSQPLPAEVLNHGTLSSGKGWLAWLCCFLWLFFWGGIGMCGAWCYDHDCGPKWLAMTAAVGGIIGMCFFVVPAVLFFTHEELKSVRLRCCRMCRRTVVDKIKYRLLSLSDEELVAVWSSQFPNSKIEIVDSQWGESGTTFLATPIEESDESAVGQSGNTGE